MAAIVKARRRLGAAFLAFSIGLGMPNELVVEICAHILRATFAVEYPRTNGVGCEMGVERAGGGWC